MPLCPNTEIRQVFGQTGPPGPIGPQGIEGPPGDPGTFPFDNLADLLAAEFDDTDSGSGITVLGYDAAGDGAGSQGFLRSYTNPTGTSLTVTDNVVTMTAADHGFESGDFITVSGTASWNTAAGAIVSIQVVDSNTFRYVKTATDCGATAVNAVITLMTAGIYRTVVGGFVYRATSKGVINCLWFGAKGSGSTADKTTNRTAIRYALQAAWGEQCECYLPKRPGSYYVDNQLFQRENTVFRIHGTIKAAPNPSAVPGDVFRVLLVAKNEVTPGYADGSGGIVTKGRNIAILGDGLGVIDGSAMDMQSQFVPATGAQSNLLPGGGGSNMVAVYGCDTVLIDSITLKDASGFALGINMSNHVTVRNPTVNTGNGNAYSAGVPLHWNGKNQDGVHFFDCTNSGVIGGEIASSDDQMAITASSAVTRNIFFIGVSCTHRLAGNRTADGGANTYVALGNACRISTEEAPPYPQASVDGVVISGCTMKGGCGALVIRGDFIGSEIKNVLFANNIIRDKTDNGITTLTDYTIRNVIVLSGCNGVKIIGNTFENLNRNILVTRNAGEAATYNIEFKQNTFANFGKIEDLNADAGNTKGYTYNVIDVATAQGNIDYISVVDNRFYNFWMGAFRGVGSGSSLVRYFTVSRNVCDLGNVYANTAVVNVGGATACISGGVGTGWTVSNNVIRNIYGAGIKFSAVVHETTISGNDLYNLGRSSSMTDAHGIYVVGAQAGPGMSALQLYDNNVNGSDQHAYVLESVDVFDCQRNRCANAGRQISATGVAMFHIFWRTSAGNAYDFTNVYGIVRNCSVITGNSAHAGFDTNLATGTPTLASALLGMPVVFENCDVSGPSTRPYITTPNSSDATPVPLPLGAIRKTTVIGGLVNSACNLNTTATADIPIPIANLGRKYRVTGIVFKNLGTAATLAGSPLAGSIYTAAAAGGDQLVAAVAVTSMTGATIIAPQTLAAVANTVVRTETELYFRLTTAHGAAATCDIEVMGELYE